MANLMTIAGVLLVTVGIAVALVTGLDPNYGLAGLVLAMIGGLLARLGQRRLPRPDRQGPPRATRKPQAPPEGNRPPGRL